MLILYYQVLILFSAMIGLMLEVIKYFIEDQVTLLVDQGEEISNEEGNYRLL